MKQMFHTGRRKAIGQFSILQRGDHGRADLVERQVAELGQKVLVDIAQAGLGVAERGQVMSLVPGADLIERRHTSERAAAFQQCGVTHLRGELSRHALTAPAALYPHALAVHLQAVVKNHVGLAVVAAFCALSGEHAREACFCGFRAHTALLRGSSQGRGGAFFYLPSRLPSCGNISPFISLSATIHGKGHKAHARALSVIFNGCNHNRIDGNYQTLNRKFLFKLPVFNSINKWLSLVHPSFLSPLYLPEGTGRSILRREGETITDAPRAPLFFNILSKLSCSIAANRQVLGSFFLSSLCGGKSSTKSARNFLKYFLEFWKKFRCVTLDARGAMRGKAATLGVQDGKSDIRSFGRSAMAGLCLYPSAICTAGDKLRAMAAPTSAGLTWERRLEVAA